MAKADVRGACPPEMLGEEEEEEEEGTALLIKVLQVALGVAYAIIGLPASADTLTYGFRAAAVLHSVPPLLTFVPSSKFHPAVVDSLQPLIFAFLSIELLMLGLVWQADHFGFIILAVTSLIFHSICVSRMPLSDATKLMFITVMLVGAASGLPFRSSTRHSLLVKPTVRDEVIFRILPVISATVLMLFMIFEVGTRSSDEEAMQAAAHELVHIRIKKDEEVARQFPEEVTNHLLEEYSEVQNDACRSPQLSNVVRVFSPYGSQETMVASQAGMAARCRLEGLASQEAPPSNPCVDWYENKELSLPSVVEDSEDSAGTW
eukprot:TRINITY_DN24515_c0_g2_i1.p1 TRINITY_DN24515_c0_g2~~TRINITY_DN24515_c0_g2_i1.p1  ORF type:complete len:319 (+),score=57.43 TRINITY_DN24515_c0_g2_i1:141-1097(+)